LPKVNAVRGSAPPATRVPYLMLQPGRNTLLIKVADDRIGFTFGIARLFSHLRGERPSRGF
jgi:hypothetical protein